MLAQDIIRNLADRGITVSLKNDAIGVHPASALTGDDRRAIRDHKAELLDLLASHDRRADAGESLLLATTDRIRAYRQRYHPAPGSCPAVGDQFSQHDANIEMRDSALFNVVVDVDFYDGRRIRIPQQSTPEGWTAPF